MALASVFAAVALVVPFSQSAHAATTLTGCRFGIDQVFDVQWDISGGNLDISGITRPYYSQALPAPYTSGSAGQYPDGFLVTGDYFQFAESGGGVSFSLYNSDGTLKHLSHASGTFRAIGNDFIFFLGNGSWGTVITTSNAYAYGSSASLPVTAENPAIPTALQYSNCSANPVSYSIGGGGGSDDDGESGDEGNSRSNSSDREKDDEEAAPVVFEEPAIGMELSGQVGSSSAGAGVSASGRGLSPGTVFSLELKGFGSLSQPTVNGVGEQDVFVELPPGIAPGTYQLILTAIGSNGQTLILSNSIVIGPDGAFVSISGNSGRVVGSATTDEERLAYTGAAAAGYGYAGLLFTLLGLAFIAYSIRARRMFSDLRELASRELDPWEVLRRPIQVPDFRRTQKLGDQRGSELASQIRKADFEFSHALAIRFIALETRLGLLVAE